MNHTGKTKIAVRSIALATLFVWAIAQTLCTFHCTVGFGGIKTASNHSMPCCDKEKPSKTAGDSESPTHDGKGASCFILNHVSVTSESVKVTPPDSWTILPVVLPPSVEFTLSDAKPSENRLRIVANLPSTLEVCLGPGLHSLAPPVLLA